MGIRRALSRGYIYLVAAQAPVEIALHCLAMKTNYKGIGIANKAGITAATSSVDSFKPDIKRILKMDICQQLRLAKSTGLANRYADRLR